ncbi:MAG TPA: carboxypeptidase regulatory-like domain-containing protein [Bryobacteraceae bacterium]|nr:carboxypeptidase regulatory-like domain-containing protein [Bryobacteraceae bacterium]
MRTGLVVVCLFAASVTAFGQAGAGTITGTVTDPEGAVVAAAPVEAKNAGTGVVYSAVTTETGNYAIAQLPVGTYEITVKAPGFKTYVHTNLAVPAAAVIRQNVSLEVGSASESVTVNAEASLLSTETADLTRNVTVQQLDNLPILGIGPNSAGASGIRNPFTLAELLPGTSFNGVNRVLVINGAPNNSEAVRVEGQDSRNNTPGVSSTQVRQPSPDAVQEVAVQTSNYAAEFGTAGGGVLNITMKSGTNDFHGSVYEYFVNEDLNAAGSFSNDGYGNKVRPRNRRNDYGGTVGGPVWIPKLYNGRNKTFFFFSWEQFRENTGLTFNDTVPTADFRNGDFSAISPNGTCSLCAQYGIQQTPLGVPTAAVDALGRPLLANTIYDPLSRSVNPANNLGYADPFPGNIIPKSRLDPIALKFQALFPQPQNGNLTQNYAGNVPSLRVTTIPSVKIDEALTSKDKFSFYYQTTGTSSQVATPLGNADGLPLEIGQYRGTFIDDMTMRLNYDRILTPTLLLHLGAGYERVNFLDDAPFKNFDPTAFGLSGFLIHRQFPSITGMCATLPGQTACNGFGGMQTVGTANQGQTHTYYQKPTYNANATWVRGNHTFKAGGELVVMGAITQPFAGVTMATGVGPTSQPFIPTVNLNGFNTGFGYASFLLGDFSSTTQTPSEDYRQGHVAWAFFAQDSWKVTPKLTVDYGLRYDLGTAVREQYGRVGQFDPNTPNANAGGRLGATMYASTCNCDFYRPNYPFAFGPRLGVAYQLDSKTVLRGGWGVVYQYTTDDGVPSIGTNAINAPAGVNAFVNIDSANAILAPAWPVTNPNVYPAPRTTAGAPYNPDRNYNRPPRQNQWSISLQRQITPNLMVEAAYVGNRIVWLNGPLGYLSQLSPADFAKYGLYPYPGTGPAGYSLAQNYADYQLLTQPLNSTAVQQRMAAAGVGNGGLLLPYAGFPATNSLLSALYPYPQFSSAAALSTIPGAPAPGTLIPLSVAESPTGNSRYDSLQAQVTKRFSHGLQAAGAFTWAKGFQRMTPQNFFDPAASVWALQQIPPMSLTFNFTYTTPALQFLKNYRFANLAVKDWQIAMFAIYQSAPFLTPPNNPVAGLLPSEEARVPGQPLYLTDVNGPVNAYTQQVLNPKAWAIVPAGQVGPAPGTLYSDFRGRRAPQENFNIGRNFRVKERFNLQIRAEFVNIFNRTYLPSPLTSVAPQLPLTKNGLGQYTNGFGVMNATAAIGTVPALAGAARSGTLIARFTF